MPLPRAGLRAAALLVFVVAIAAAGLIFYDSSRPQDDSHEPVLSLGTLRQVLNEMPIETLSGEEREGLLTLREGTKLSHDIYLRYSEAWELPVFDSNAFNAQTHSDAVGVLLSRYRVTDPAAGAVEGQFTMTQFRDLYATLQTDGAESREAALFQSMRLEELGIIYVKNLLAQTDNQDLTLVYRELLRAPP